MHTHPTQQAQHENGTHATAHISLGMTCVAWNMASNKNMGFWFNAKSWHQGADMHHPPPPSMNVAHTQQNGALWMRQLVHTAHTHTCVRGHTT